MALAQTSIILHADPVPIIDAEINDRPVRLEVDLRVINGLAVNTATAERLRLQRVPFAAIRFSLDGGGAIRGRLARPRIVFADRNARAFAGIFPAPVSVRADGVIGPGALPYDRITVVLGAEPTSARDIVFTLEDPDIWVGAAQVGGETVRVNFDLAGAATVFNRAAVRLFDRAGAIPAAGELVETPYMLGLSSLMQPVTTELTVEGLALDPVFARTNSPLLGALEPDAVVIEGEMEDASPPHIAIGRAALTQAGCASISVDRRTRRLTLRCAV